MPLIKSNSKKAFKENVEQEMEAGKPKDQSLAIAYSIKRKNRKKMAKGGEARNESAASEQRPMPEERDKDAKQVSRNSGNKSASKDSWTDNSTIEQAQRPSKTTLSRPKLVGSDAFSVRYKDEIDQDLHRMDSEPPASDRQQPKQSYNEDGAKRQGPSVSDMQAQHNNKRPPYNKAIEDQYAQDMAAAEMKKVQSYANGGPVMEPGDDGIELMERSDEGRLQSMESPSEDEGDAEAHSLNELSPNRQGPRVSDDERQHNSGRKAYAEGGHIQFNDAEDYDSSMELNPAHGKHSADDSEDQPHEEEQMEREDSIAAAIMARKERSGQYSDSDEDRMSMMALGGEILEDGGDIHSHGSMDTHEDADQADLSRNADEDANEEDQASFDALRKENYSESEGLRELDSSMDSGQHGNDEESDSEDKHDRVSRIMSKMNLKRQFKQR